MGVAQPLAKRAMSVSAAFQLAVGTNRYRKPKLLAPKVCGRNGNAWFKVQGVKFRR